MTEIQIAKAIFLTLFAALALGSLLLPRAYIYRGAPSAARWRDLRLWALLLVAIHAVVYWWL